jgi:hypothetical protein
MFSRNCLLTAMFLTMLGGCSGILRGHAERPTGDRSDTSTVIYVVRRGWHIDIGFAAGDLVPPLKSLTSRFPSARYLVFGFGDRHYLMNKDRGPPETFAALWPGKAVVLVTGLTASPMEAFGAGQVIALNVTVVQARAAEAFVWNSLSRQNQNVDPDTAGPYQGSLYFSANPRYSALHTCNTWVAEVLRAAGMPIHSTGTIFAWQLWAQVNRMESGARISIQTQ